MSKKYRLSTALDVDDILMECTAYAIRLANEKYGFNPPLTIYEKDRWGKVGTRADAIYPYFSDPDFYSTVGEVKRVCGYGKSERCLCRVQCRGTYT